MAKAFKGYTLSSEGASIAIPARSVAEAVQKAVALFGADCYSKGPNNTYLLSIEGLWTPLHVEES